jgi:type IV pilus assembly protein PilF
MPFNRQVRAKISIVNLCLVLACAVLAGCITTTESVFTEEASPSKALEKRLELARHYIGEGNWDAAKRNLEMATQVDSKNPEVYEAFALVYQSTGEFELAEENFRKAISLNGKFSRCRNNYAAFLYSQERYEEAEDQLEFVVKDTLYSGRPNAFVNLGLCKLKLFDTEGAEEAFVRALAMDKSNQIALLEVARIRYEAQDYSTARKYYDLYTRAVRQQSAAGLLLGIQLAKVNGDRDAEASYSMALRNLYPQSAEYQSYQRANRK